MGFMFKGAVRAVRMHAWSLVICALAVGAVTVPTKGLAQTQVSFSTEPLVVRNDRGGLLRDRLRQIRQLRQESRPVEIRGAICFSTCTMLIGLPNTCVSPNTTFGFHGPSSYGRPLDPERFNYAS